MFKILKNRENLYTLLRYRKKTKTKTQKDIMNLMVDNFSRDFNILNSLKSLPNTSFFECLILDLQME